MTSPAFANLRSRTQTAVAERMPEHIRRMSWSSEAIAQHQRDRLRELLAHAIAHSPFHAKRLVGIDPATIDVADLAHLPVMTKADMMADLDDVLTDRRLDRAKIQSAIAATGREPVPLSDSYLCLASGGSSGDSGLFVFDVHSFAQFICSIMRPAIVRAASAAGVPATGMPPSGPKVAFVAAASPIHLTGLAPVMTAGTAINFIPVPVTLPLTEIVDRLNRMQPVGLYGYPSMLARLAEERQAGRLDIDVASVNSTSETLSPEWRTAIREAFDVPLVDSFGSSEGLTGSTDPDDRVFTFAPDGCIVELVDDADQPVPAGTRSAKILVTNLANRVQPLIRYAIHDLFVQRPDAAGHGHLRADVDGRVDEVLHISGIDVHPHVVRSILVRHPGVVDYEVRQVSGGISLSLLARAAVDLEQVRRCVRGALAELGLRDPSVSAQVVPDLHRHPQTGKRRRFFAA